MHKLFWPLVIGALALGAHYLTAPHEGGLPDFAHDRVWLSWLTVIGGGMAAVACLRLLFRGGLRTARYVVIWIGVFAGLATAYTLRGQVPLVIDRINGGLNPSIALSRTQGEAELRRGWDGHYRAETEVNGIPVRMMIDTGASMVLLPYEQVAEFGIDPSKLDFSIPVQTANGTSSVAPVRLSSVKVGAIAVFDVHAAVAQPGKLKMGLLGMSFLDKLSETSFRGDKLILRN